MIVGLQEKLTEKDRNHQGLHEGAWSTLRNTNQRWDKEAGEGGFYRETSVEGLATWLFCGARMINGRAMEELLLHVKSSVQMLSD